MTAASPFTWIVLAIAAVVGAIVAFIKWLNSGSETAINFKVSVIRTFNGLLSFFDKVPVFFQFIWFSLLNGVGNFKVGFLKVIQDVVNGVITAINWLIDKLNKIPGVSIEAIDQVTFGTEAALKEEAKQQQRALQQQEAIDEVYRKSAAREAELLENEARWRLEASLKDYEGFDESDDVLDYLESNNAIMDSNDYSELLNSVNSLSDLDSVGSVGSIKNDVGIKSEDLRYLRDIREVEYVNQYSTVRPVVNVQFGDVRETVDMNKLLPAVESVAVESMKSYMRG